MQGFGNATPSEAAEAEVGPWGCPAAASARMSRQAWQKNTTIDFEWLRCVSLIQLAGTQFV